MSVTSAVLFAISANIDCLAVGLSYGIKAVHIDWKNNVLIACISFLGTFISMVAGTFIVNVISVKTANIFGSSVLIAIGLVMVIHYFQETRGNKKVKHLQDYDKDYSGTINGKEVLALSLGLTANNAGVGIGASITGTPILLSCLLTFIFSMLFIYISQYLGKTFLSKYLDHLASLISALLILILGMYELFI